MHCCLRIVFTSCADQDVTENINGSENKPGVTVSMSLEGNMQSNQTAPVSRANTNIGYKQMRPLASLRQ